MVLKILMMGKFWQYGLMASSWRKALGKALPGLFSRSALMEYPQKSREVAKNKRTALNIQSSSLRKKGDSNPRYPYEYDSLANCWFQPLTHPSFCAGDRKPAKPVFKSDAKVRKDFELSA